jgi:hypothetical protein
MLGPDGVQLPRGGEQVLRAQVLHGQDLSDDAEEEGRQEAFSHGFLLWGLDFPRHYTRTGG